MAIAHHLGFPRIGKNRELKWAVERYWRSEITQSQLIEIGANLCLTNWQAQRKAGLDFICVGDFSWYDHVLDTASLLGAVPARFGNDFDKVDLDTYFRMARGRAPSGTDTFACEMTKWFDTNYHYLVPEFHAAQKFKISCHKLFAEIKAAQQLNLPIKVILLGPLSFLWLGKSKELKFDKLALLARLQLIYREILLKLRELNVTWVQIDEPILTLDLPSVWQNAFQQTYQFLEIPDLNLLLTTYFGGLHQNTELACQLPTAGVHIDLVRAPEQLSTVLTHLPLQKILSIGIVDGRNIWRTDLRKALKILQPVHEKLGERLWVGSSCSLLHCPVDLDCETQLDAEFKSWLAFARQKLQEIKLLTTALNDGDEAIHDALLENDKAIKSRQTSKRIHHPEVKKRLENLTESMSKRASPYQKREQLQKSKLNLPLLPTTTIGSFPQTQAIRELRRDYKSKKISSEQYIVKLNEQIAHVIHKQSQLGLDVLVHGEAERNDMVEYFGEELEGIAFTGEGWVQSYGSRCVKPPIIFGDVYRSHPITVAWASFAQSLTDKPVKGMLTGPITILCWSFVRDDQPRFDTAKEIALALRDEAIDLEKAGINIIQIDEPAIREGLPLRRPDWAHYLQEAVCCFRLAASGVSDHIQIHTHMCYSEFNDIIEAIAELDADVITIETSRSDMELLNAFEKFKYPNQIGPGVYDIHSPRVPTVAEIVNLLDKAAQFIPPTQLWVNPDCGLKTRDWEETEAALRNMVAAANLLREKWQQR